MIYLYIILSILLINAVLVYQLRRLRNNLKLTTHIGKIKCKKYNKAINTLTGYWIWSILLEKK